LDTNLAKQLRIRSILCKILLGALSSPDPVVYPTADVESSLIQHHETDVIGFGFHLGCYSVFIGMNEVPPREIWDCDDPDFLGGKTPSELAVHQE
jgi:hypothetical protein